MGRAGLFYSHFRSDKFHMAAQASHQITADSFALSHSLK